MKISIPFGSCTESVEWDDASKYCYVVGAYPYTNKHKLSDHFYYANCSFKEFITKNMKTKVDNYMHIVRNNLVIEDGYVVCVKRDNNWTILGKDGYEIFDTREDALKEIEDLKSGNHYYYKKIRNPLRLAKQIFVLDNENL